jgi:molybdopterin converting factor subunit 1
MPVIEMLYFGPLREKRGTHRETIETSASTAALLYDELSERFGFDLPRHRLKVAINDTFSDWQTLLAEGDTIVFIPPVAGG